MKPLIRLKNRLLEIDLVVLVAILVVYEFVLRPVVVRQVFEEECHNSKIDNRTSRILGIFKRPGATQVGRGRRKSSDLHQRTSKDDATFQIHQTRRVSVQTWCGKRLKNQPPLKLDHFNWIRERSVVSCIIPKVMSTFWYNILYKYYGLPPKEDIGYFGRELVKFLTDIPANDTNIDFKKEVEGSFSFVFVRHPFTRFVSSFLDKIASVDVPLVYAQIRKDVLRFNGVTSGQRPPSFVEFVKYLMANQAMGGYVDPHFQPLYEYCGFCHVSYDVIGKMETAKNDIRHVLRMTGLNDGLNEPVNPDARPNASSDGNSSQPVTAAIAETLFRQLNDRQRGFLFAKYQHDFDMFGYNPYFYDGFTML